MDDLAGKLSELLGSPEGLEKIKSLAGLLGQTSFPQNPAGDMPSAPAAAPSPLSGINMDSMKGIAEMLGQAFQNSPEAGAPPASAAPPAPGGLGLDPGMLQTVMKLAPLLSSFRQEDDNTRLLHALRPLLKEPRRKKLDEAIRMMQMMRMIPLLKNQGIF